MIHKFLGHLKIALFLAPIQISVGGELKYHRGEVGLARNDGEYFPEGRVDVLRVDGQVTGRFVILVVIEQLDRGDWSVILEIHGCGGEGRARETGKGGEVCIHSLFG